jgi:hypothetical protein
MRIRVCEENIKAFERNASAMGTITLLLLAPLLIFPGFPSSMAIIK